jgi:hypothetical protein
MLKSKKVKLAGAALGLVLTTVFPSFLRADDVIEKAGVAVGLTAGNMWVIPAKAISVAIGLASGALSFVVTGGNADLTKQIWQDTTQGPYLVTPEVAKKGIGERPELLDKK